MAVLGLYILVALVTPLLHDDVGSHLQSKTHCDACAAHATASNVESSSFQGAHGGRLEACVPRDVAAKAFADRPASPGRAPPVESTAA